MVTGEIHMECDGEKLTMMNARTGSDTSNQAGEAAGAREQGFVLSLMEAEDQRELAGALGG
jgi:hypothetical protein